MGRRMKTFNDLVGRWNVDLVADDDQAGEWDFDDEPEQPEPAPASTTQTPSSPALPSTHWLAHPITMPAWLALLLLACCIAVEIIVTRLVL